MGLDGQVRCRCIQDGFAKPHPFPERLAIDETIEPFLTGNPTLDENLVHDRWFRDSCLHHGYVAQERLGNISSIAQVRELLRSLERDKTARFPILLEKVVYSGTHSGDFLPACESAGLLKEMAAADQLRGIWDACDREFFTSLRRLCEASLETRNPIIF
jgi:hypothetical protein